MMGRGEAAKHSLDMLIYVYVLLISVEVRTIMIYSLCILENFLSWFWETQVIPESIK